MSSKTKKSKTGRCCDCKYGELYGKEYDYSLELEDRIYFPRSTAVQSNNSDRCTHDLNTVVDNVHGGVKVIDTITDFREETCQGKYFKDKWEPKVKKIIEERRKEEERIKDQDMTIYAIIIGVILAVLIIIKYSN